MPKWINRTAGSAARNGTTSHTLTYPAASANSLLVAIVEGGVTTTFPAGWTKQAGQIGNTELCVATRTASAGETSVVVTHNGSNYPIAYVIYEFPAGSTFGVTAGQANISSDTAWSTLASVPSGSTVFAALDLRVGSAAYTAVSTAWTTPATEDLDQFDAFATTEGDYLTVAYVDSFTGGSLTPASTTTITGANVSDGERLIFSVLPAAAANPLTVTLALSPTAGTVPASVTATATASGGTGTPKTYAWNWGDGNTTAAGSSTSATHSYPTPGNYTVTVTATNT